MLSADGQRLRCTVECKTSAQDALCQDACAGRCQVVTASPNVMTFDELCGSENVDYCKAHCSGQLVQRRSVAGTNSRAQHTKWLADARSLLNSLGLSREELRKLYSEYYVLATKPPGRTKRRVGASSNTKRSAPTYDSNDVLARPTQAHTSSFVDNAFQVGNDTNGAPHSLIVDVLRCCRASFALDARPGQVKGPAMPLPLISDDALKPEAPRRVSPDKWQVIEETLDQLLDWDVVELSASKVSYPVSLIWQGKKWRFLQPERLLHS